MTLRTALAVACVALIVSASSVLLSVVLFSKASETTNALCVLRDDFATRVTASKAFLKEHPHGIPGINAGVIRQGIGNQERTIHALRGLSCSS